MGAHQPVSRRSRAVCSPIPDLLDLDLSMVASSQRAHGQHPGTSSLQSASDLARPLGQVSGLSRAHWLCATGLFLASSVYHLASYTNLNDHFDRISRGRQIAQYGELPFRDFFDPGYFLTLLSSATVQRLFGDNLLGEALLNVTCFSIGFTLTFLLLVRLTRSLPIAILVTALVIAAGPRFYDYDKVLFYPLGIFLCWRYIDRTAARDLVLFALGTAVAFWFRYDNGIYIACAGGVALLVVHWDDRAAFAQRLALYGTVIVLASLPFLFFLQVSGGVLEYIHQITSYATREGQRTSVFRFPTLDIDTDAPLLLIGWPEPSGPPIRLRWVRGVDETERVTLERQFSLARPEYVDDRTWSYVLQDSAREHVRNLVGHPRVEDTASIDRGTFKVLSSEPLWDRFRAFVNLPNVTVLPGTTSPENNFALWYYVFITIPGLAILLTVWLILTQKAGARWQPAAARSLSLVAICVLIEAFILRDPIRGRIGAVAPPVAILGVWTVATLWALRPPPAVHANGADGWMSRMRQAVTTQALSRVVVLTCLIVGVLVVWSDRLLQIPKAPARLAEKLNSLATSPSPQRLLPTEALAGVARYARDCTARNDRVLATWFVPELYHFATRGFAGGMVVWFGGHWSDTSFQYTTLRRLDEQSVPIAIIDMSRYDNFQQNYDLVDAYLQAHYRIAGESNLGNHNVAADGYRVMVRKEYTPVRTYEPWGLPCFQ